MKLKNVAVTVAALVLAVSMTACGSSSSTAASTSEAASAQSETSASSAVAEENSASSEAASEASSSEAASEVSSEAASSEAASSEACLLYTSITTHGKDAAVSLCVHPVLRPQYHNAIGKARPQQNDDTRIFYHYNAGVSRNFNIFSKTSTNSSPFAAFRFLFISALPKNG